MARTPTRGGKGSNQYQTRGASAFVDGVPVVDYSRGADMINAMAQDMADDAALPDWEPSLEAAGFGPDVTGVEADILGGLTPDSLRLLAMVSGNDPATMEANAGAEAPPEGPRAVMEPVDPAYQSMIDAEAAAWAFTPPSNSDTLKAGRPKKADKQAKWAAHPDPFVREYAAETIHRPGNAHGHQVRATMTISRSTAPSAVEESRPAMDPVDPMYLALIEAERAMWAFASISDSDACEAQHSDQARPTRWATHPDEHVRAWAGDSKNTDPETLRYLAADTSSLVRQRVALNVNTPPDVLAFLATDPAFMVRDGVARNERAPIGLLERLAERPGTKDSARVTLRDRRRARR